MVRRVKRLNPTAKPATSGAGGDRQGELFVLYRYHAVFTDSPLPLVQARRPTGRTRSSSRSTPTGAAARWRICPTLSSGVGPVSGLTCVFVLWTVSSRRRSARTARARVCSARCRAAVVRCRELSARIRSACRFLVDLADHLVQVGQDFGVHLGHPGVPVRLGLVDEGQGAAAVLTKFGPLAQAQWAKTRYGMATQTLPHGYCGLPVQKSCPHANACLTCPVFLTGPEFRPELREHRGRTLTLIDQAEAHGHARVAQMNTEVLANLDKMIGEIDKEPAGAADAS